MKTGFQVETNTGPRALDIDFHTLIVAGWAGRDRAAVEHHIEELQALGVPRPSRVPLYYRVASNQLTQADRVQVVGPHTSGEAEAFVFTQGGALYVSVASDHTDRKLEAHSVALSKQVCVKPVARSAWLHSEVADHWDELILRSYIVENGQSVLYQEGQVASLRTPLELIVDHERGVLPEGAGMTCGTMAAIGGIRPATSFTMELYDPRRQRSLRHSYQIDVLPEVS
ncbi:DUF2848 domain-containing protein [Hylemonella gracilis]|jgi:hypothetical protein|uniref:DUF2848 domain-containing protein n=1 Tax=Hylemonella gracilis TaxID=80880 RepID=A0A4P6UL03_9BURK|nr:DUF2848 domain-containing protein [Hylemonella gracilis]QBK05882.1 DUF2848 domain-containing protein [Hylemonella gracilis]